MMELMERAKAVCRVTSSAYDIEIEDLICAGILDLGISDIDKDKLSVKNMDRLVLRALMTYVSMNFKLNNQQIDVSVYDRLLESYNMQKSQLLMNSSYTNWGGMNG